MQEYRLRKGLDLPVAGAPDQHISGNKDVSTVALLGEDYIGLKPRITVSEGDDVKRGDVLLFHKDMPDVKMVSPVTGRVKAIERGPRRVLESIVIDVEDLNDTGVDFSSVGQQSLAEKLCAAGLWTSFRTRPYSKIPDPATRPAAIYVTAMDTEPHAPDAKLVIGEQAEAFEVGLAAITSLVDGNTYLCQETGANIPGASLRDVVVAGFSGPHPAGLPGTHLHFLEPPHTDRPVWTIWYQDVIAIGRLLITGFLDPVKIVSLSGPLCLNPRLVRTVFGASIDDLTDGEYATGKPARLISGSVLSGRAVGETTAYLGRYARQVTIMEEDQAQIVLGWIRPMFSKYALQPVLGSAFSKKLYALTTNLNGGRRAMVPTGTFEQLMPQDFLPTQLLRALLVMDTDAAQALGVLELDEEDLGLVGFACPAKYEYGLALRACLEKIEKEG